MEIDFKSILGLVTALGIGAGGGGFGTFSYNEGARVLELEAEQAKRNDIQRLLDSQTLAHERAMKAAQEGYSESLDAIVRALTR